MKIQMTGWERIYKQSGWLWILFLSLSVQPIAAQRITNVRFAQSGQAVQVFYTLSRLPYDAFMMLDLYVSTDGGERFVGPLMQVRGDIGKVDTNGAKSVVWQAVDERGGLDGLIVFEFRGEVQRKKQEADNLLMYSVSGSSGFGLMYGRVARWGGYVRGKTNFSFTDASYTCDNSGEFNYESNDTYYTVDKEARRSRLGITAGALFRPCGTVYLFAGGGYGYRRLMWHARTFDNTSDHPIGDLWAVNTSCSAEGIEAEVGGIYRYKRLAVSIGVNTVGFSFFEVNGGIGLFF